MNLTIFSRSQRHIVMSKIWYPCVIFWTSEWIFGQTCIDTLLGGGKEFDQIRLPWPNFQGHSTTLKCTKYGFRSLSFAQVEGFWPNLHRYIVGERKELVKFWWTWPYFQATLWNVQNMVSMRYLLNQLMDFDHTRIYTLYGGGKELIRFWWPWPNFQDHRGTLKCQILTKLCFFVCYLLNWT